MSDIIAAYRRATSALLEAGMAQYKAECPEEYQAIAVAVQRGAFFAVEASLAPSGLDEVRVDLVAVDGQRINLMHVENLENNCTLIQ
jgi:hypothetical protein